MTTVSINGNDYQLNWVTGNVLESNKNMETRVSGGGGSVHQGTGNIRSVVSTTTVHDQIFITDSGGKEHSFQLQDIDVACRPGNKLSVIWAIKNGQKSGPYVAVVNHSTSEKFINEPTLKKMYYPINKVLLNVLLVIVVFISFILIFAIHFKALIPILLFGAWVAYMEKKTKAKVQKFKEDLQPDEFN